VRVATWNMNHMKRASEERATAWSLLRNLELDVALVQEAVPPPGVEAIYRAGGIVVRA
jgi:hypothetical protein